MADWAFDVGAVGAPVTASSLSWNHTCTGSNQILVVSTLAQTNTVTGVTYNSVSMTQLGSAVQNSANSFWAQLWLLIGPTTGTNAVKISASGSIQMSGCSGSWSNLRQSSQPEVATVGGTTQTLAVTTSADRALVIIGISMNNAAATANAQTTARAQDTTNGILLGDNGSPQTPPGIVTLGTSVGTAWNGHIASFAPLTVGNMFLAMN
jgi:hypothetical protein